MKTTFTFGLISALTLTGLALGQSTATIALSDGLACNASAHPVFVSTSLDTAVSSTQSTGSAGAGAGRLQFSDVTVGKKSDDCSVSLYNLLFLGKRLMSVVIAQKNAVGQEVLRLTLTNAVITSIAEASSTGGEKVTFGYDKITILDPISGSQTNYDRIVGAAR